MKTRLYAMDVMDVMDEMDTSEESTEVREEGGRAEAVVSDKKVNLAFVLDKKFHLAVGPEKKVAKEHARRW